MSRYIDADNYKKDLIQLGFLPALVVSVLDKQPTADVVEVKHGYWVEENKRTSSSKFICSACGELAYYVQPNRDRNWKKCCPYKFCPNCNAKMDFERR